MCMSCFTELATTWFRFRSTGALSDNKGGKALVSGGSGLSVVVRGKSACASSSALDGNESCVGSSVVFDCVVSGFYDWFWQRPFLLAVQLVQVLLSLTHTQFTQRPLPLHRCQVKMGTPGPHFHMKLGMRVPNFLIFWGPLGPQFYIKMGTLSEA